MKPIKKSFFVALAVIFILWVITIVIVFKYPVGKKNESMWTHTTSENIEKLNVTGYGIYVNNQKIGYSISKEEKTNCGFRISEKSYMNINAYGMSQNVTTFTISEADKDLSLKSFYFELVSGEHNVRTNGVIKNDSIYLTIETAGEKKNEVFAIGDKPFVPASVERLVQLIKVKKDTVYHYSIFEPTSEKIVDVEIKKDGKETINVGDKNYNADVVIVKMLGLESKLYFDTDGTMLMESSPMGITMRREPLDGLKTFAKGNEGLKIFQTYAIYPEGRIPEPRNTQHLVLDLSGIAPDYQFPSDERQKYNNGTVTIDVLKPVKGFSVNDIDKSKFASSLKSTVFIPCDDIEFKNLAKKITEGARDLSEASNKIIDWVFTNVKKAPTFSVPYAKEVLKSRVGDCNEHAVLFAALARALGIPTKVVVGVVYVDGAFYYHAWNEVYLGNWVACDPVFGQHLADATHLKLEQGTLLDFVKVIELVGQLHIKIIESS